MRSCQQNGWPGVSDGCLVEHAASGVGCGVSGSGFGGWLRELRQARAWSMARLARECGLSIGTVARIEREVQEPRVSSALLLARALRPSRGELFELVRPEDEELARLLRAFGQSVRRHRRAARVPATELAERCGVPLTIIVNTELGRIEPGLALIRSLCQALGVTANQLTGYYPPPRKRGRASRRPGA